MKAKVIVTLVAALIVTTPSGVEFPTTPVKVMSPVPAVKPRVCAPSSVLLKAISPPVVVRLVAPVRVVAPV